MRMPCYQWNVQQEQEEVAVEQEEKREKAVRNHLRKNDLQSQTNKTYF